MKKPWETCDFCGGLEGAVIKREQGIWSDEIFDKWLNEHCECCPFFASGEACVYGDIEISSLRRLYEKTLRTRLL